MCIKINNEHLGPIVRLPDLKGLGMKLQKYNPRFFFEVWLHECNTHTYIDLLIQNR